MFGYVRPVRGEMKVSDLEQYQSVYCGLCRTLARRYGLAARFLVNYDCTFLAMLLARPGQSVCVRRRCPVHPLGGRMCLEHCASLDTAADIAVILGWWALADRARDASFFPSLPYRAACLVLKRAYRKASERQSDFARLAEGKLRELGALEQKQCASVDQAADPFAVIVQAAGRSTDPVRERILRELLYHLGRIVYILDAADDLQEDCRTGAYNPLRFRFALERDRLSPQQEQTIRNSLQLSHNALAGAYALLDPGPFARTVENILYLGLPAVTQAVFSGSWKRVRGGKDKF